MASSKELPEQVDRTMRRRRFTIPLAVLMCAQIGTTSDNASVSIAVNSIMNTFGASVNDVQMAIMVYSLVSAAFMIAGGMIGIIVGWRRSIRIGCAIAFLGELVLVFAPTMSVFIWGGRVVVGLGASLLLPSVLGYIPAFCEGRDRVVAFGSIAGASAFATLLVIPLGIIIDVYGLQSVFVVLAAWFALVFAGTFLLPDAGVARPALKLDFLGIVLSALGLALFLIGASRISAWGIIKPLAACPFTVLGISPALPMIACGAIVLCAMALVERRVEARNGFALLPRSFVENKHVRSGLLSVMLPYFYMGAQGIVMTPYIQLVGGLSAAQTGMLAILSAVPMMLFAMLIPKRMPNANPRTIIRIGFVLVACAPLIMASGLEPHGINAALFVAVVVAGTGMGIINSQANNAVASSVDARDAQQSGGIQGMSRNVGLALGTAVLGSVLLISVGINFNIRMASSGIDSAVASQIESTDVSFMSDSSFFEQVVEPLGTDEATQQALVDANVQARLESARIALMIISMIAALSLLGTRNINVPKQNES